ncbi:hypothetical protein EI94DRAFT_1756260 [Lactarius quietus]|nr:hypothetical protein EI94DRAFT_1756260 [Lactarius quietus]
MNSSKSRTNVYMMYIRHRSRRCWIASLYLTSRSKLSSICVRARYLGRSPVYASRDSFLSFELERDSSRSAFD